ncbi:MAG: hypothetical protein V5A27_06365 [Halapricum sp.]
MSDERSGDRQNPEVSTPYVTLEIGDEAYAVEHPMAEHRTRSDCILVLWDTHASTHELEPVIPELHRSVVGVGYDGTRAWRVAEPPHDFPTETDARNGQEGDPAFDSGSYFRYLLELKGDLHACHTNLHRCELDPATGDPVDPVPDNHLTIAGEGLRFPRPVHTVTRRRGMTAVLLYAWAHREHLDYAADATLDTADYVYAFDSDGTLRWRKDPAYLDMSYQDEGRGEGLWLYPDHCVGNPSKVDIETGH